MVMEIGREYVRFDAPESDGRSTDPKPQRRHWLAGLFQSSRGDGRPTRDQLRYRPSWQSDDDFGVCCDVTCEAHFGVFKRRHHCRACGYIYCKRHSSNRVDIMKMGYANVRACTFCHKLLKDEEQAIPPETLAGRVNALLEGSYLCSSDSLSEAHEIDTTDGEVYMAPDHPAFLAHHQHQHQHRPRGGREGERIFELESFARGPPLMRESDDRDVARGGGGGGAPGSICGLDPRPGHTSPSEDTASNTASAYCSFPSRSPSCPTIVSRAVSAATAPLCAVSEVPSAGVSREPSLSQP